MLRLLQVDYVEVELGDHAVDEWLKVVLFVLPVKEHIMDLVLAIEFLEGLQMVIDHGVAANYARQEMLQQ